MVLLFVPKRTGVNWMWEHSVHRTAHNVGYTIITPAGHRRLPSQVETGFLFVCACVNGFIHRWERLSVKYAEVAKCLKKTQVKWVSTTHFWLVMGSWCQFKWLSSWTLPIPSMQRVDPVHCVNTLCASLYFSLLSTIQMVNCHSSWLLYCYVCLFFSNIKKLHG